MSDGSWMAKNQLMKPVQISQVDWTTTQARNTNIVLLDFPKILTSQESLVLRTLRMYAFYKLSPCFRVQINATVFHQGQLICSFDPFSLCTQRPDLYPFSQFYATGLPNVKIMASHSDAIELKVPFIHPRSYLTTNTSENYCNMGTFRITVLNPLSAAEGASTSLSVTTWIYAIDAEVHVPIQDHDPILDLPPLPSQFESTSFISDAIDKGKNVITQSTDIFGNIVSGNIGQALRKGQGLIDTLGSIFGFDYPARTLQPPKTISPLENLSLSKGVSQSQRLALDPFSLHKLSDDIASESLEAMNLMKIIQMPMLLTQFKFSSTDVRTTLLKTFIVNPCVAPVLNKNLQHTFLSYVCNGFTYWAGGLVYDIEIVATKFHSGKLIFAYIPNASVAPEYLSTSDSLPNVIIDIQQTSAARFVVPFTSSTPMKNTFAPNEGNEVNYSDSCTGILACYVQNTLAFASNVSPSIEINVYVSASSDFSLYVPRKPTQRQLSLSLENYELKDSFEPTSLILNANKNQIQTPQTVLSYNSNFTIPREHFGEDYSLLDLIKRFSFFRYTTTAFPDNTDYSSSGLYVCPTYADFPKPESVDYLTYWSKLYNCWTGSIRYKFIPRVDKNTQLGLQISHVPTYNLLNVSSVDGSNYLERSGGYATVRTQLMQDCGVEIEVPYYSKYNMLLTSIHQDALLRPEVANVSFNGILTYTYLFNAGQSIDTITTDVYIAAGDDFRLIYIRSPPIDTTTIIFSISTLDA